MKKSIFTDFVGNSSRTRAIEYFVTWKGAKILHSDLTDAEIGDGVQVAKEIAFLFNEKFIKKVDNGYTLNTRNKVAKNFHVLFSSILKQEIPKLESKFKKANSMKKSKMDTH